MTKENKRTNNLNDDKITSSPVNENPCTSSPASSRADASAGGWTNGPENDCEPAISGMCLEDVGGSADRESRESETRNVDGILDGLMNGIEKNENNKNQEKSNEDSIFRDSNPEVVTQIDRREHEDDDHEEEEEDEEDLEEERDERQGLERQELHELQENFEQDRLNGIDNDEEMELAMTIIRRQEMNSRPGAYFVPGINYDYNPPGRTQAADSSADAGNGISVGANDVENPTSFSEETKEEVIILEGFLAPEPRRNSVGHSRRSSANSQSLSNDSNRGFPGETIEQKVERIKRHLLANAITLDDSAVKTIPTKEDEELSESSDGGDDEERSHLGSNEGSAWTSIKQSWMEASFLRRLMFVMTVALMCAAVVTLGVLFGKTNHDSTTNTYTADSETYEDPCDSNGEGRSQLEGNATIRWMIGRDIVSSITPEEVLLDETSPQRKALRWIVCQDNISANFLNQHEDEKLNSRGANLAQGFQTKQTETRTGYGFHNSGNTPQSHIIRRYILATLYYSTSLHGPWHDDWNFLNGYQHECSWHKKYNRSNFHFGDVDLAGIVCQTSASREILIDDEDSVIGRLVVNLRIKNNLTGTLPPELGHLVDLADIFIEQQEHLSGSLPAMTRGLTLLESVGILFNGPDFGGEIPKSLLELPSLTYLTVKQNAGSWSLPNNVEKISPNIANLDLSNYGFQGTIPRWIYESNVINLDLSFSTFHGAIFPEDEVFNFFPRIEFLSFYGNRHLNGTLPETLGRLGGTLKALALGDNQIGGSLPESLGNLTNLELLSLDQNDMTGTLPSSLANMNSLKHLTLSSNSFRGSVYVLESMKNLTSVFIHSNDFSGALPADLFHGVSSDSSLYLDVGSNHFSGDVPASYGNLPNLTYFGATRNNFSGNNVGQTTCDNIEFIIMDCSACSCCNICCDTRDSTNSGDICGFHMNSFQFLGLNCGVWWMHCNEPQTFYDIEPI